MAQTRRSNSEASRRCIVSPVWNHRRPAIGAEIGILWPACLYLIFPMRELLFVIFRYLKRQRVIEFWFAMFECRHVSAFGRLDWFYLFRIKRKNIKIKNERDRDQLPV
jgi:hypothetical protein